MRESTVENYLRRRVRAAGGECEKFTSPGRRNVPDDLVTADNGWLAFVEVKRPGEKPTPAQARDHERRRARGFRVFVLDSFEAVDHFMENHYGK